MPNMWGGLWDGLDEEDEENVLAFPETDWLKPVTVEMEFVEVSPEVLGILTGGVMGTEPAQMFALEVVAPIKRTFWQWLLRRPKQYRTIYIPQARLETREE